MTDSGVCVEMSREREEPDGDARAKISSCSKYSQAKPKVHRFSPFIFMRGHTCISRGPIPPNPPKTTTRYTVSQRKSPQGIAPQGIVPQCIVPHVRYCAARKVLYSKFMASHLSDGEIIFQVELALLSHHEARRGAPPPARVHLGCTCRRR